MGDDTRDVVVVSDTSVLIDLERGRLLEAAFRLPFAFAVPDLLYERELKPNDGGRLLELGLRVSELDGDGVAAALTYRDRVPALSLPDCFALALATQSHWTLLTGDAALRRLAQQLKVDCHGLLWLLDEMQSAEAATAQALHSGLLAISMHPRCRLPKGEVRERLSALAAQAGQRAGRLAVRGGCQRRRTNAGTAASARLFRRQRCQPMSHTKLLARITARADVFGGKPIVRDMRISVELILSLLAQGATQEELLEDYPRLEPDDIRACVAYAHAVVSGTLLPVP